MQWFNQTDDANQDSYILSVFYQILLPACFHPLLICMHLPCIFFFYKEHRYFPIAKNLNSIGQGGGGGRKHMELPI